MNILSIQSWVAYGHVGNASAVFPLQRLGAEVWAVNTVQFSNHPGYGAFTGDRYEGASIRSLVDGIAARGVFPRCDAVLSGYLGKLDVGEAAVAAVDAVKAANPAALYCCDPVIGDAGRCYVDRELAEFIRDAAVPAADIATPNQFELTYLTGLGCATFAEAKAAISALHRRGPRIVLATGLHLDETPGDTVDLLASEDGRVDHLRTPLLPIDVHGAGDLLSGLFMFHRMTTGSTAQALSMAASSVWNVLRWTAERGARELEIVAAQEEFVHPSRVFTTSEC